MKKLQKGMLLSVIAAVLILGTSEVYAEDAGISDEHAETIQIIALSATVVGALISVAEGYTSRPDNTGFSAKKLVSALITAVMGAMLLVNLGAIPEQTNGLTLIGVFVMYMLLGYGADKGLARLDK